MEDLTASGSNFSSLEQGRGPLVSRAALIYCGFWLIIPFSSFTSHTLVLVPPTLVLLFIGTFVLISVSRTISLSVSLILPLVCIVYFITTQSVIGAPFERYMGVILSFLYFIVVICFGYKLRSVDRYRLEKKFITYSVVLLVAECVWRLSHPATEYAVFEGSGDVRWIYQYKFGGLMYVDSNAVGIHLVILLFFVFFIEGESGERWTITKIVIFILLVFTFSRAAWAGAFLGWIYLRFLRDKGIFFYIVNSVAAVVIVFFAYQLFIRQKLESDISFLSKLDIYHSVIEYLSKSTAAELLFGVGFANSAEVLGIYAHNYFAVFLIESGIIGLFLIVLVLVSFSYFTRKKALVILVPFVITTLSASITFLPYLYVIMALMVLHQRDRYEWSHEN